MNNKFLMFVNNINSKTLPKNRTFINNSQKFKNIFVKEISNYFLENSDKNLNTLNTETFLKAINKDFSPSFLSYRKIEFQKLNLKSNEIKKTENRKEKDYVENNFYPLPIEKIGSKNQVFKIYIDKENCKIQLNGENFVFDIKGINTLTDLSKNIEKREFKEFFETLNKIIEVVKTKNSDVEIEIKFNEGKVDFKIFSLKPKEEDKFTDFRILETDISGINFMDKKEVKEFFELLKSIDKNGLKNEINKTDLPKNIEKKEFKEFVETLNKIIKVVKTKNSDVEIEIKFNEGKVDFKIFSLKPKEEDKFTDFRILETDISGINFMDKKEVKEFFELLKSIDKNGLKNEINKTDLPKNIEKKEFKEFVETLNKIIKVVKTKNSDVEIEIKFNEGKVDFKIFSLKPKEEDKFADFRILETDISGVNFIEKNEVNFKNLYDNLIYKIKETLEETAKIKIDNKLANAEIIFNLNDNEKLVVKLIYTKNQDTVNIIFASQNEKVLNSIKENINFFAEAFNKENINVNIFLNQNLTNFKEQFLNYPILQNYHIFEEENKTRIFNYIEEKNYINDLGLDIFV
jgi:G3E family GTPase